jgi:hypothetical protein
MAINFTYPPKPIPVGGDRLLIIDVEDIENPLSTKEINIQNIVDLSPQGTVTSVGISTIPAFSVTGSPVTESGIIAIGVQGGSVGQFLDSTGNWSTPIIPDEFNLKVTDGITTESNVNIIRVAGGVVTGNGAGSATITIQAGSSVTVAPNTGLAIDVSDVISTIYNTTIGDAVESVAVGGADPTPASVWKTKTIVQALDTILFPTILASISTPKAISLSASGSGGVAEIGTTVARILSANFTRGVITNGDGTINANPLVGASTLYTFSGTGISSTPQAGNTLAISNTVVSGSNNWAVTVNHSVGTGPYYDNKGVLGTNLDALRVAGSITDNTSTPSEPPFTTITGVYPYYYFISNSPISTNDMAVAITNGSAIKTIASSTGDITVPYVLSSQYIAVAYPATSTTKTKYFVTNLDNGPITLVFNPVATQATSSSSGYWTGVNFKIHTSINAITNSGPTIKLSNS